MTTELFSPPYSTPGLGIPSGATLLGPRLFGPAKVQTRSSLSDTRFRAGGESGWSLNGDGTVEFRLAEITGQFRSQRNATTGRLVKL